MQVRNRRSGALRRKHIAIAVGAAFMQSMWMQPAWAQSQYRAEPGKNELPNADFATINGVKQGTVSTSGNTRTFDQGTNASAIVEARGANGALGGFVLGADGKVVFNATSASDSTLVRSLYTNIWGSVEAKHRLFFSSSEGV